jgi:hypothetical protein
MSKATIILVNDINHGNSLASSHFGKGFTPICKAKSLPGAT